MNKFLICWKDPMKAIILKYLRPTVVSIRKWNFINSIPEILRILDINIPAPGVHRGRGRTPDLLITLFKS